MQEHPLPAFLGALAILLSGVVTAEDPPPKPAAKSVTVYPIVLTTSRDISASLPERFAEVVGTFLERAGMDELEIAEEPFPIPEDGVGAAVSSAFGKFVRDNPPKTSYAAFGQVIADRQSINEIRTVIADKGGIVVFADCADQRVVGESKVQPRDLMSACLFLVERMGEVWNLADPLRDDAPQGKMAERLTKRSGLRPRTSSTPCPLGSYR